MIASTIDVSATQVGVVTILWVTLTQLAASALGGYLALPANEMSPEDQNYAAQLVAQHTGLSVLQARNRVTAAFAELRNATASAATQARQHADQLRKAS